MSNFQDGFFQLLCYTGRKEKTNNRISKKKKIKRLTFIWRKVRNTESAY